MNSKDFETLLLRGDPQLRSLQVGELLVEDPQAATTRNRLLYLRSILSGNPEIFATRQQFDEWLEEKDGYGFIAGQLIKNNGWKEEEKERIQSELKLAREKWDDPELERLGGRNDFDHTTTASDLRELPGKFRELFPSLERLFLWSFASLRSLPELPPGLKVLDLRHARALQGLEALPDGLETLDLTGCANLAKLPRQPFKKLKRLYLHGCTSITQEEFRDFLKFADCAGQLEELELHGNPWLRTLSLPDQCPRLKVLRLADCPNLATLPNWAAWSSLHHLDLQGCSRLHHLPRLPDHRLGFLALHGCHGLKEYLGQDLNERDLGLRRGDNQADLFKLRTRLGDATHEVPRCKLLLLGNGRGGKTTLAKALQYRELDEAERLKREDDLKPNDKEDVSHAIQQWDWRVDLNQKGLETIPLASVRIWDFGGQETYHGTHRTFAASGALYVVVLTEKHPQPKDPQNQFEPSEWQRYNRQRPLKYWLDYILDLDRAHGGRDDARARVLVVHSRWIEGSLRPSVLADNSIQLTDRQRQMIVGEHFVGSMPNEWEHSDFETIFRKDLKRELHRQVREEGIRIPELFHRLMEAIQDTVRDVTSISDKGAVLSWLEWCRMVAEAADQCRVEALEEAEVEAVTRMLHQSGDLFWMREMERTVILHQKSALQEIYRLLDFRNLELQEFRKSVEDRYGLFDARVLKEQWWKQHLPGLQNQLLEFMRLCQICVPVFGPGVDGVVGEPWLALDPTLLPALESVEKYLHYDLFREGVKVSPARPWTLKPMEGVERPFSESGFRELQAWAVARLGDRVRIWCNGFQYVSIDPKNRVGFRLWWEGKGGNPDAYEGSLMVRHWLDGAGEQSASLLCLDQWLFGPHGPFPKDAWLLPHEIGAGESMPDGRTRYDVAISVRGVQSQAAAVLENALKEAGKSVFLYITDDQADSVSKVYDAIRKARLQILWVSEEYLAQGYENRYSMHECANAIFAWTRGQGLPLEEVHIKDLPEGNDQVVVVLYENKTPTFDFHADFEKRLTMALDSMAGHMDRELSTSTKEVNKVRLAKHMEKFKAARGPSGPFAKFFIDARVAGKPTFAYPAPHSPEESASLAAKLAALL